MNPVAPASRPVPPTMVCRSTIDPSAVLVNTPAFFTSRTPRYRLTAPVIVEFEVKALTVVLAVSVSAAAAAAPETSTVRTFRDENMVHSLLLGPEIVCGQVDLTIAVRCLTDVLRRESACNVRPRSGTQRCAFINDHWERKIMPEVSFDNLLIIFLIAVGVPLLLGFGPRWRVPSVVIEIIAGVIVGPSVLGWVHIDLPLQILAVFGLAFLLFLAGLEIDLKGLRGNLLQVAVLGYLVTLVLGIAVGAGLGALNWVTSPLLVAITLSATSLGLIVPVLKDAKQADSPVGQTTIAASSVADFSAILLLTLFFSTSGGGIGEKLVLLLIFAALVGVGAVLLLRAGRSMRLGDVLLRIQDTTAEIRVRFAILLLVALVALAGHLGLETILGAFLAGAIVGLVDRDSSTHPHFRIKLEAIGYGFLIPVFFISSGVRLDLSGLLDSPSALLRVPLFLVALLIVRGIPALLSIRRLGVRQSVASGLLQATSLPFIVTATQIGQATGLMTPVTSAALVCAGLLSVLIFPVIALGILRAVPRSTASVEAVSKV